MAQRPITQEMKLHKLHSAHEIYNKIIREKHCINLKMLAINGSDLISLGYKPGKKIGLLLDWLLNQVLEDPSLNQREQLIELLNSAP